MTNLKKSIIFLGNPVPEKMVEQSKVHNVNIADNIAQNTLIYGLNKSYGDDLTVVSVSSEKNPGYLNLMSNVHAELISSNNIHRAVYYLSITKNYTKKLFELLKHSSKDMDVIVITNGPYIYMALPVLIARLRYKINWIPFLIGSVEIPEAKFPYNLVSKLSKWTSKKADGAITYVAKSVSDYMPGKPFVEVVYLIEDSLMDTYKKNQSKKPEKFTISYTGALTNIYNIDIVLDVIQKTGDKYRWVFAGVGQNAEKIQELSNNSRYDVEYLGSVSNVEAAELQKSSHMLLCLKGGDHSKINQYYSKYAASGKLIEYLCSGTPVLAGDIPSFPDSIKQFMTCEGEQTVDRVIKDIESIKAGYDAKLASAKRGQKYAFEHFTADHQSKSIYKFLESL